MNAGVEAELIACERQRRDALVADDMASLGALMRDDLIHVHTTGNVHDKTQLLHHAGNFLRFQEVERGPLTIRLLAANVAVMTGSMTNYVARRGVDETVMVSAFVTQVWVRGDADWQCASFHAVKQDDSAAK